MKAKKITNQKQGVVDKATTVERRGESSTRPQILLQTPAADIQDGETSNPPDLRTSDGTITIIFKSREKGQWREVDRLIVDQSDPFHVERVARRYARDNHTTFYDKKLRKITPAQCFRAATEDGTNTIFMKHGSELTVTRAIVASVSESLDTDTEPERNRKRPQ